MERKAMVGWLITDDEERAFSRPYEGLLGKKGLDVHIFEECYPAIEEFVSTHYDLIIINPLVAPGYPVGEADPVMIAIMAGPYCNAVAFTKVGMQVIKRIKAGGSANRETPIILATFSDLGAGYGLSLEKVMKETGANEAINLGHPDGIESFERVVRSYLG